MPFVLSETKVLPVNRVSCMRTRFKRHKRIEHRKLSCASEFIRIEKHIVKDIEHIFASRATRRAEVCSYNDYYYIPRM